MRFIEKWTEGEVLKFPAQEQHAHLGSGDEHMAVFALNNQQLPLIGYANVPSHLRPVYEHPNNVRFRAQSSKRGVDQEEEIKLNEDEQKVLEGLPSAKNKRRRKNPAGPQRPSRRRRVVQLHTDMSSSQQEEPVEPARPRARKPRTVKHRVWATVGRNELSQKKEVWLYVKTTGNKIQYLTPSESPGLWTVLSRREDPVGRARRTWGAVVFNVTGRGKATKVTTAAPFDSKDMEELEKKCEDTDSEEDSDQA